MNPPAGPIRTELSEAVVGGIRERGSEAVGLILVGGARLVLAAAVLLLLHLFGATAFGFDIVSLPFAGVSVLAVALSLIATHRTRLPGSPDTRREQADDGRHRDVAARLFVR